MNYNGVTGGEDKFFQIYNTLFLLSILHIQPIPGLHHPCYLPEKREETMVRKILLYLVGIVALLFGLGLVLPDKVHVERTAEIAAPPETLFELVSNYKSWHEWSPWFDIDPDTQYEISGSGPGHKMVWRSDDPKVGNGSQIITDYQPPHKVVSLLDFGDMGRAIATFEIAPTGSGSTVTWSMDTRMREGVPFFMKPLATYMGFFMDGMIGKDYEKGFANLKAAAETA